jgi:hypothetical protein
MRDIRIEPEPGIGLVLRHELQKGTGRKPVSCSIPELWERPELLCRSALPALAYLTDLLEFLPIQQHAMMTQLAYSPFGG